MERNFIHQPLMFLVCLVLTSASVACPCFHRFYLYSIFSSEELDSYCETIPIDPKNPANREVFMYSYYKGAGRKPSNYGEVSSLERRCKLQVDNQVIADEYLPVIEDKRSCDDEILSTCKALKHKTWPLYW